MDSPLINTGTPIWLSFLRPGTIVREGQMMLDSPCEKMPSSLANLSDNQKRAILYGLK